MRLGPDSSAETRISADCAWAGRIRVLRRCFRHLRGWKARERSTLLFVKPDLKLCSAVYEPRPIRTHMGHAATGAGRVVSLGVFSWSKAMNDLSGPKTAAYGFQDAIIKDQSVPPTETSTHPTELHLIIKTNEVR